MLHWMGSWWFVNLAALAAALLFLILWDMPAKLAAEPDARNLILPTLAGGAVWLLLAFFRHFMIEKRP